MQLYRWIEHPEEAPRETIWWGPAGCGKTHAICAWIYHLCCMYPVKVLIVRETRSSLTNSVMPIFEKVLGPDHSSLIHGGTRSHRQGYLMGHGAEVVLGSMDEPSRFRSSEYDVIYQNELQESRDEEGFQEHHRSLRRGMGPFHLLIADMNATDPNHYARRRMRESTAYEMIGNVRDNPVYFNHVTSQFTDEGVAYLEGLALNMTSGVSRARLLENKWVGASGMVLEDWDEQVHLITARVEVVQGRFWLVIPKVKGDIRRELVRFVGSQDIGFENPGVAQVWAADYDDRWYMVAEVYRTHWNHAVWAKAWGKLYADFPLLERIVTDHDQAFVDALNSHLTRLAEADPRDPVDAFARIWDKHRGPTGEKAGIDEVRRRLQPRGDGTRGLYILAGCLRYGRDEELYRRGKPWHTAMEIPGVVYEEPKPGKPAHETPRKIDDHGFDAMRGAMTYLMRSRPEDRPVPPVFDASSINSRIPGLAEKWIEMGFDEVPEYGGRRPEEDERDAG